MANPIIKIKRGSTAPVATLQAGEFAIDQAAKNLYLGVENGGVVTNEIVGGEGTFATKAYTDAAVASLGSSGGAALTQEIADRTAADTALDGKITVEKNRIDAILSAADADKDSFAEIVSLINSVDTTNDSAFAGYVTSNNTALAQEITDRTSADSALAARATDLEDKTQNIDLAGTNAGNTQINGVLFVGGAFTDGGVAIENSGISAQSLEVMVDDIAHFNAGTIDLIASTRAITVSGDLIGDGASTLDGFVIDGGTY